MTEGDFNPESHYGRGTIALTQLNVIKITVCQLDHHNNHTGTLGDEPEVTLRTHSGNLPMQVIYRGTTFNFHFQTPSLAQAFAFTNHQLTYRGYTYRYSRPVFKDQVVKAANWRFTELCYQRGSAPAIA